jgi:hypothetical protein
VRVGLRRQIIARALAAADVLNKGFSMVVRDTCAYGKGVAFILATRDVTDDASYG